MFNFDIDKLEQTIIAETPEEKCFIKYCREFDFEPSDLHKHVTRIRDNTVFEILGFYKKGHFMCLKAKYINSNSIAYLDIRTIKNPKYFSF